MAYATYLELMNNMRLDHNPLLDPAIHSGNVLQVLETAIKLKDQATITYCSTFLQSLVNAANRDDLLAIAKKYDLKELHSFITQQKSKSPEEHSRLKAELLATDSEKAFKKALREVQSRLKTPQSFAEAATLLFEVLATQPSHPTTLNDLLKRRNTRIDIAKLAPDFYKKLPQRVYKHCITYYSSNERVFPLIEKFAHHFPSKAFEAIRFISGKSNTLKIKESLLKPMESIITEFLGRRKLGRQLKRFAPLWEKQLRSAFKQPVTPAKKTYCQQLFKMLATHFKDDFVTFLVPKYSRKKNEVEREIRQILSTKTDALDQKLSRVFALIGRDRHRAGQYSQADLHYTYASLFSPELSTGDQARWAMSLLVLGEKEAAKGKLESVTNFSDADEIDLFVQACAKCGTRYTGSEDVTLAQLMLKNLHNGILNKTLDRCTEHLKTLLSELGTTEEKIEVMQTMIDKFLQPELDNRFKKQFLTLWENQFNRYYKTDPRYTKKFLSILAEHSPEHLAALLSQKVLGGTKDDILKILRSKDPLNKKMPQVYLLLANKLYAAGKHQGTDLLYTYASAKLDEANTARWAISLLRLGKKEPAKTKLETLANRLNNVVVSKAVLECAESYYKAYAAAQKKNFVSRLFSKSKNAEYIKTALKMYRWSWESPCEAEIKQRIFAEKIVPYYKATLKPKLLQAKFYSLEKELANKQPKISTLCYREVINQTIETKHKNGFFKSIFAKITRSDKKSEQGKFYEELLKLAKQMEQKESHTTKLCYVGIDRIINARTTEEKITLFLNLGKVVEEKHPELSIHCYLKAMKDIKARVKAKYFKAFHERDLLENFCIAVKRFYLNTKKTKQSIEYLDQALDLLGNMKKIVGQKEVGVFNKKIVPTVTKDMSYLVVDILLSLKEEDS